MLSTATRNTLLRLRKGDGFLAIRSRTPPLRNYVASSKQSGLLRPKTSKSAPVSKKLLRIQQLRSTTGATATASDKSLGPYGLRKVDYSYPPPRWPIPPDYPPPKSPILRSLRYFPQFLAAMAAMGGVYIYFNQDEEVYEYWRQVEQGNVPVEFFDEDDEDDDDDDDEDEWEDDQDKEDVSSQKQ